LQSQQLVPYYLGEAKPFLKWAGGKGRLLAEIEPFLPPADLRQRYHEPFLGGGAMFFHLLPQTSFLSDRLQEVVITYRVVRDNLSELTAKLEDYQKRHFAGGKAFYYAVREADPKSLDMVERAARVIYLNKTCFNGIYRVNAAGKFNVPMGVYKKPKIADEPTLSADSAALRNSTIKHLDYSNAMEKAKKHDFVYLDPPYFGRYTGYHQSGFTMEEQENLARMFKKLHDRGACLMLSDGSDERIANLYNGFTVVHLRSRVTLSGEVKGRREFEELLVINYDPKSGDLLSVG
jgi:DNA adenine methylase